MELYRSSSGRELPSPSRRVADQVKACTPRCGRVGNEGTRGLLGRFLGGTCSSHQMGEKVVSIVLKQKRIYVGGFIFLNVHHHPWGNDPILTVACVFKRVGSTTYLVSFL